MPVAVGKVHTTTTTTGNHDYQQRTISMSSDNGKPQTVDREYVREYLANLAKPVYAECRENRHAFHDKSKLSQVDPEDDSVIERLKVCRRCRTKRIETLHVDHATRTSQRVAVRYEDRPEGYLMEPGHGRLASDGLEVIRYENLLNEMRRQAGAR